MTITENLVWEILHAALYDVTEGNKEDGIKALEEALEILDEVKYS